MRFTTFSTVVFLLTNSISALATPPSPPNTDLKFDPIPAADEMFTLEQLSTANATLADEISRATADIDAKLASLNPETTTAEELAKIFRAAPLQCYAHRSDFPHKSHTHAAANNLIANSPPSTVCPNNFNPCVNYGQYGSARIGTCSFWSSNIGVKCHTLAWSAKHIANMCQGPDGKGAGNYLFEEAHVYGIVERII